jgi:hypothetical protein
VEYRFNFLRNAGKLASGYWVTLGPMSCTEILKARVSPEIKRQAQAIAEREFVSEAAWLKRLVIREIGLYEVSGFTDSDVRRAGCTHRHGREVRDSRGIFGLLQPSGACAIFVL